MVSFSRPTSPPIDFEELFRQITNQDVNGFPTNQSSAVGSYGKDYPNLEELNYDVMGVNEAVNLVQSQRADTPMPTSSLPAEGAFFGAPSSTPYSGPLPTSTQSMSATGTINPLQLRSSYRADLVEGNRQFTGEAPTPEVEFKKPVERVELTVDPCDDCGRKGVDCKVVQGGPKTCTGCHKSKIHCSFLDAAAAGPSVDVKPTAAQLRAAIYVGSSDEEALADRKFKKHKYTRMSPSPVVSSSRSSSVIDIRLNHLIVRLQSTRHFVVRAREHFDDAIAEMEEAIDEMEQYQARRVEKKRKRGE